MIVSPDRHIIKGKIVVSDFDGTISNSTWRNHYAMNGLWDDFHKMTSMDDPNEEVVKTLRILQELGAEIVVLTGKPDQYRRETEKWFHKNDFYPDHLLMRKVNDWSKAPEMKLTMLWDHLRQKNMTRHDVLVILEDNTKCVDAYRSSGFRCWQVRPGGV